MAWKVRERFSNAMEQQRESMLWNSTGKCRDGEGRLSTDKQWNSTGKQRYGEALTSTEKERQFMEMTGDGVAWKGHAKQGR